MAKQMVQKNIQDLNLSDDFLFAKVMANKEICRKVLEKILNISIKKISIPTTQRTIDLILEGKGVRLDVYVNDEHGSIYNVEMQRGKKKELPKRSRYYQGSIDLDLISAGELYTKLRKTFIIFICTFDPFQEKRHIYTFQNFCVQNKELSLGDETTKIFLNTKGKLDDVDEEVKEFLYYIEHTTDMFAKNAKSNWIRDIHKEVKRVKESKELEVEYMTLYMRDMENREEGREEGRTEERVSIIMSMYENGMPLEQISKIVKIPIEDIKQLLNKEDILES